MRTCSLKLHLPAAEMEDTGAPRMPFKILAVLVCVILSLTPITCSGEVPIPTQAVLPMSAPLVKLLCLSLHQGCGTLMLASGAEEDFLKPMPWVLEMSVNPSRDLRDRSCEPCDALNPLGSMCCGMCAFWVRSPHSYCHCFLHGYLSWLNMALGLLTWVGHAGEWKEPVGFGEARMGWALQ